MPSLHVGSKQNRNRIRLGAPSYREAKGGDLSLFSSAMKTSSRSTLFTFGQPTPSRRLALSPASRGISRVRPKFPGAPGSRPFCGRNLGMRFLGPFLLPVKSIPD